MNDAATPLSRRHHTVPRFYLRGFAANDQVATVRLPGSQRFLQSINNATVAKDFYMVAGHEDGDDFVEKALSEIEGEAARILKTIEDGVWPLPADDRSTLGYFMALQGVRIPSQRLTLDHVAAQMMRLRVGAGGKAILRRELEAQGGEVTDELVDSVWELATRPEGPPIRRSNAEHIVQMLELSDKLTKYIVGRPWSLVRFDRRSLITSDSPIGLVPDASHEQWQGVGYMTAWGITFPLTRKLGLLMTSPQAAIEEGVSAADVHSGAMDVVQDGTTAIEKSFNHHTVANANEWIFHHPEDERFVPEDLPEPNPITMSMGEERMVFDGEPWFDSAK